jgi:hypothetical protein
MGFDKCHRMPERTPSSQLVRRFQSRYSNRDDEKTRLKSGRMPVECHLTGILSDPPGAVTSIW